MILRLLCIWLVFYSLRSTFVVWEMWRHHNMRWKWPPFASREEWTRRAIFWKVLASMFANNKHSLLYSISIHFPTTLCELTIYTNTHEQQPYCVGTLSQMTERSAERRVRQETGWLAGGPLLHVPTIRRTTDTFLFISPTTNVLLFKSRCNIVIGVRIIKELPGLVGSGAPCIFYLTFKNRASYIWDGRTATLQMLHFTYFFQQL
jgi:hypothetical protein